MIKPPSLTALLSQSSRLCAAWEEALADHELDDQFSLREQLTLDACGLTLEHGQALRELLSHKLQSSALALLRTQHEALLRAAWLYYAAPEAAIGALAAPHTPATLKRANNLPLTAALLREVEKSDAPQVLKQGLRQFRDMSWAGANSYAHSGLLPLGKLSSGHPERQLVQAVQVSNAHCYAACMVCAGIYDPINAGASINVIAVSHPECMVRVGV